MWSVILLLIASGSLVRYRRIIYLKSVLHHHLLAHCHQVPCQAYVIMSFHSFYSPALWINSVFTCINTDVIVSAVYHMKQTGWEKISQTDVTEIYYQFKAEKDLAEKWASHFARLQFEFVWFIETELCSLMLCDSDSSCFKDWVSGGVRCLKA